MCRTVADAAILLQALSGADPLDPVTAAPAGAPGGSDDLVKALDGATLRGARLGVARNFFGWHPEIDRQMTGVFELLKSLGAELVDPAEVPNTKEYGDSEYEVLLYEFKQGLNAYLAGLPANGQPRSLAELIAWNEANAAREMPWFGQEIFLAAEAKGPLTEAAYLEALAKNHRFSRAEGIDGVLTKHRLDALVCPTMGPPYLTDWVNGDHYAGSCTSPPAVSGYPHVTVPAGFVHGLPWGLSFFGTAWSDAKLVRYAAAFETARGARRPPRFLATAEL
jgi:amidase